LLKLFKKFTGFQITEKIWQIKVMID